jgi:hypothetical protein
MSCRFVHFGGRPGFRPRGSSGSSTAHCASVRSARLLTAKVATRSPCRWSSSSLTHLPETSCVTGQRHAGNSRSLLATQLTFETRPSALTFWHGHRDPHTLDTQEGGHGTVRSRARDQEAGAGDSGQEPRPRRPLRRRRSGRVLPMPAGIPARAGGSAVGGPFPGGAGARVIRGLVTPPWAWTHSGAAPASVLVWRPPPG